MGNWQEKVAQKKRTTFEKIPKAWVQDQILTDFRDRPYSQVSTYLDEVLPESENEITKLTACQIATKVARRELTSSDVCYAFCHRAALAHQILNCCVEIFFESALERAKELDRILEQTGEVVGPLHGVPISLKDQVNLPGIETTIGYVSYIGEKSQKKSLLAKALEEKGAIFYVKTAVPTAMLASETVSNVHGITLNAVNIEFSSGGSSGGEGALIGARGSPLGVGTDIGGSIRIPAAFQGLYGLRPSNGRIPYMDVTNSYAGQEIIQSVIGPLSASLEDLQLFTKTVVDSHTWDEDPKVVPIPWRDQSSLRQRKLRIGLMLWDKLVMPHPPVIRALKETCQSLLKEGHEIVEWDFPLQKELLETADQVYGADFYQEVEETLKLSGEPILEYMNLARKSCLNGRADPQPLSIAESWELVKKKNFFREQFFKKWNASAALTQEGEPIDAIICPVWPSAAFGANEVKFGVENYTVPFNMLDCASVVLPVTYVDKAIDLPDATYQPANELDAMQFGYYSAEKFDKMPICIQVVCRRLEEEKVLTVASIIQDACRSFEEHTNN
ncbi:LAMI_0C00320g1_1 [Lachancea mirantina]|uniref:amidase n=1 Tax=Lachancea mirantina TaxID=1230905 RepID=A0A1G4IZF5_9SACH|nr:LAMI_0C00320g1_1 [Lachancea mirantina]